MYCLVLGRGGLVLVFGGLRCNKVWVVFFGYRHKRRFVPFALSVRYALGCNFLFLGVDNQPVGVVFVLSFASVGCFAVFRHMW